MELQPKDKMFCLYQIPDQWRDLGCEVGRRQLSVVLPRLLCHSLSPIKRMEQTEDMTRRNRQLQGPVADPASATARITDPKPPFLERISPKAEHWLRSWKMWIQILALPLTA